ncbi:MAG TPA: alpha/beta hydrolase-fold protein [Blastocatellia bacterium]
MTTGLKMLTFALMLSAVTLSSCAARDTSFLSRSLQTETGTFKYRVYLPTGWSSDRKWPVILYLHGAGERGDDNMQQIDVGLGPAIKQHPDRFPFVVVFPQCPSDYWWSQPEMEEVATKALDSATKEFNGDTRRTYLTGISMGGYGAWDLAEKNPGKFAALAPVCGGIVPPPYLRSLFTSPPVDESGDPYLTAARRIGKTPVWIFHGGSDPTVPVSESRQMNAALKAIGGEVKYTEYPGVGHNSWDEAYAEPDLPVWLLSKSL